jgi:hypothetical protein
MENFVDAEMFKTSTVYQLAAVTSGYVIGGN